MARNRCKSLRKMDSAKFGQHWPKPSICKFQEEKLDVSPKLQCTNSMLVASEHALCPVCPREIDKKKQGQVKSSHDSANKGKSEVFAMSARGGPPGPRCCMSLYINDAQRLPIQK